MIADYTFNKCADYALRLNPLGMVQTPWEMLIFCVSFFIICILLLFYLSVCLSKTSTFNHLKYTRLEFIVGDLKDHSFIPGQGQR